mmetsp:Transcript_112618/g.155525  ORF Transcript_112618/g.155525 Transcript_112618/m.155525 type:complete len:111 (+) Transcript_112618:164-496(+)
MHMFRVYSSLIVFVFPYTFTETGFIGSLSALLIALLLNMFSAYLVIKARDAFKNENIIGLNELVGKAFGPKWEKVSKVLIVIGDVTYIFCLGMYLVQQVTIMNPGNNMLV